jgi:SAM-dependent methyltransferase
MDNYEFCASWAASQPGCATARILDYGCGAGQIVAALRERGLDAVGCDVFYEGGDASRRLSPDLVSSGVIHRMDGDRIPFDDRTFDLVINNQVMEHVVDLDRVLTEIARVITPGGAVLNLFPDKGVWREGHCGVPFLHWFPKGSTPRIYYAAALRRVGLGYHKQDKTVMAWSRDFCQWLDDWTHYRPLSEIEATYRRHFHDVVHLEDTWLQQRLGSRRGLAATLPRWLQRQIAIKLGHLTFVARRPRAAGETR